MCAVDKCHAYNKTWTCPPGCGTIAQCTERMKQYDWGILVQTTAELEDSLDFEGMQQGQEDHAKHCKEFLKELHGVYKEILPLCSACL